MRNVLVLLLGVITTVPAVAQPAPPADANVERARTHYFRAWENMRAEAFDVAAQEFGAAIELYPKYALAHYGLGRAYLSLRRYNDAIRALSACSTIYSEQASRVFTGQLDANRQRQDRLMELQDLRTQYSKGPQNAGTADTMRQIDNAIRMTGNAFDRGQNVSIETPVPSFVS